MISLYVKTTEDMEKLGRHLVPARPPAPNTRRRSFFPNAARLTGIIYLKGRSLSSGNQKKTRRPPER